ncbi:MAG: sulfotransferase family protein, partial [Methylocella sp.]
MRNVILVLGMHRSGTSAAAGLFVKLGGAQPKTLMSSGPGNERGYFESQALMTFHDELLASAGSSWTDWRQFNPAWYQSPTGAAFRKRAKQLFKDEFDGEPLAVLKDPRVCRFVPFWLEVLAGIKARARVVIPVRAPLEVAFSMRKRDGFSLATGALLWLRHITDAEIASRGLPRSIFTWDQLLRDWRSVAEKASAELGLPWPRLSDATAHEIEAFLGDDLVHHGVSAAEHAAHPDIHEWTISAYAAMLELAREPRSSSALKTLDDVRDAFNRASRMFGRT